MLHWLAHLITQTTSRLIRNASLFSTFSLLKWGGSFQDHFDQKWSPSLSKLFEISSLSEMPNHFLWEKWSKGHLRFTTWRLRLKARRSPWGLASLEKENSDRSIIRISKSSIFDHFERFPLLRDFICCNWWLFFVLWFRTCLVVWFEKIAMKIP